MTDKLLSYKDLWDQFKISRSYVKNLVKAGTFPPPRRIGKKNLWFETEIMEWAQSFKPSAKQPTPNCAPAPHQASCDAAN